MEQLGLLFYMLLGYAQINWLVITVFAVGALVLNFLAMSKAKGFFNLPAIKLTAIAYLLVFGLLFVSLPGLTGSSFAYMGYWLDWLLLVLMSAGYAAASVLWIYPVVKLYQQTGSKKAA
ncbi:glucose transporter [Thiomicrospira microaerophila]|uniref:glucose transporter n=1 Tax=Thiomicrospira microaerophila TaxID=406020 RepID=UPI00201073E5|nr:glucose transporter [Thiomicrospira microaerophila]UQB42088.1 glucose transporter [Thiomicrospira microaerophila]